ncbi:hypothetical protein GCM10009744_32170 [Kribbella alba]|uniref:Uncharacterized protein n=1 Tax=Kribbella alba TaxID=190197 RepID=A0ABN2FDW0_9ACTN
MTIQHNDPTERALSNDPDSRHPLFSPLTFTEAAHLIRLALTAAAAQGFPATYDGAGAMVVTPPAELALTGSGPEIVVGLTNLARAVSAHSRHRWPQLVEEHLAHLASSLLHGPPPPPADPERELFLRLAAARSLPPEWTASAPEFLPGLLSVPATHENGMVAMHLDPSDFGMTWPEAQRIGLANLRRLTDTVDYAEYGDVRVAVLSGSSFAASRALVLDTVLRESLHVENPEYGVLVALPVRHLLLVHVIQDLSVITALSMMLHLTGHAHAEEPGPLSPWVYLVDKDGWHPATASEPDEDLHFRLTPRMLALVDELRQLE